MFFLISPEFHKIYKYYIKYVLFRRQRGGYGEAFSSMSQILTLDQLERYCLDNSLRNFDVMNYKESATAEISRNIVIPEKPVVVGSFGSGLEKGNRLREESNKELQKARRFARESASELVKYRKNLVLVTGFCPDESIPTIVAEEVKRIDSSIPIIGISPWTDYEHAERLAKKEGKVMDISKKVHDMVIYSHYCDFGLRDDLNAKFVDGAIAIRGSTGTNHELAALYENGKVAGRLIGLGGATDAQDDIIESFEEDGKHQYVVFAESNPHELVRKVVAQIYVDNYLKQNKETSTIDVYIHSDHTGIAAPILNIRRFRRREGEEDWRDAHDRRYPFVSYTRSDLAYAGKLLTGMQKAAMREYVEDLLQGDVVKVPSYRNGEVGVLFFPARDGIRELVPVALETIANEKQEKVFYNRLDQDKLVA